MEKLKNWIIRNFYGNKCVFIKNKTEMKSSSQWGNWIGSVYQSKNNWAIKRHTCQCIGLGAGKNISLLRTRVQRWNFQPPLWIIRLWKGFQYTEWKIIHWYRDELIHCHSRDTALEIYKKWGDGEGKTVRSTYYKSYIVLRRACWLQWSRTLKFSTSLEGNAASWLMAL